MSAPDIAPLAGSATAKRGFRWGRFTIHFGNAKLGRRAQMRAFIFEAHLYITFMFDVVLFAAIAVIACVAFYSVLGKSVGRGSDDAYKPDELSGAKGDGEADVVALRQADGALNAALVKAGHSPGLTAIAQADPGFSPAHFIDGAKSAYSMILEAFASGDRDTLRELLTDDVYAVYDAAITDRENQDLVQTTDLGSLRTTQIKDARVDGKMAVIRVLYEADIASALRNADGELVNGDPDVLSSISEHWTYIRDIGSDDPTWRLSEVEPSEGDELGSDPTPDTSA